MAEEPVEIDIVAAFGGTADYGQRFAIYVPNKDRDGKSVDQKRWIDRTLELLSEISGGATAMPPVTGAWLNPETKKLIIEEPVVVYAYVKPERFAERLKDLSAFVKEMGRELQQGAIACEFDGDFFTVEDFSN